MWARCMVATGAACAVYAITLVAFTEAQKRGALPEVMAFALACLSLQVALMEAWRHDR